MFDRNQRCVVYGACAFVLIGSASVMAQMDGPSSPWPVGFDGPITPIHPHVRAVSPTEGAMFPSGSALFDNYSSYTLTNLTNPPASLIPLHGQSNAQNVPWSTTEFFGVANAQTLMAIGDTPPLGTPPHGLVTTRYALAARGSIDTGYNPKFGILGSNRHNLFFPSVTKPVIISQDFYLDSPDDQPRTCVWWSPVSFSTFSIYDRIFFGGTNLQGQLAGFANAQGVTNRFLHLGRPPTGQGEVFYGSAPTTVFPFPVKKWFTMMTHTSINASGGGYSVWIKTPDTIAAHPPYIDPRMSNGDIPPIDGIAHGWVNTYPGRGDNLATSSVREGIGVAQTRFGQNASQMGQFGQAPIFDHPSFDGLQYGWGFDDPFNVNFQPSNVYFANYSVRGDFTILTCPPDFTGDGVVNGADLATLLASWGPDGGFGPLDLNVDGVVDGVDLASVLAAWGACF